MNTRDTIEELFRRMGAGDPDGIAALHAERVDWKVNWPAGEAAAIPWIRDWSTRADIAEFHRALAAAFVPGEDAVSVERVLVDGPDAVVLGETARTFRSTGKRFTMMFALHLTVQNGLISRYHVYEDSLAVARAFA
ncbi:nuclear transport factor 2 family protein [Amycolatopsis anabasis]|uniref:nuclear transport factor 2 family protein n=1 Tax=Amycolatopsis anabasis TaxID=1840409 RepID=UPI00131AE055|nr:nuclear transport factor 2 family protein [Amycolatopsis anabasis]